MLSRIPLISFAIGWFIVTFAAFLLKGNVSSDTDDLLWICSFVMCVLTLAKMVADWRAQRAKKDVREQR